jgi:hypothetical protein
MTRTLACSAIGAGGESGARRRTGPGHVLASWEVMSNSSSRSFPVTVTHLPVTRCQICHRPVAYRPGTISEVLTGHYLRAHPETLASPTR